MLSGVLFRRQPDGSIRPEFVNQYILTDVYLSSITTPELRQPILPSIATLVNPMSSLFRIIVHILRTILLVVLSHLAGSRQAIRRISAANTGLLYHDGRALATCESGPPMRIVLPSLETVGWFDGNMAEGEAKPAQDNEVFGGNHLGSFMREWTTAHPRVDPQTKDLILFHSTFLAKPYVHYSIIPPAEEIGSQYPAPRLVNAGIPGISSPKMMHDFGVSLTSTVIMDLPLSLNPRNIAKNKPVISYNPSTPSRFGVFPRWQPELIRWFETSPCCIFHTANTWDEYTYDAVTNASSLAAVNMLACRLTSATLVFSAGNVAAPQPVLSKKPSMYEPEEEQCRLYYYRFALATGGASDSEKITHQFALTSIPFEFPSLRDSHSMSAARFIYGCSMSADSFDAALGRAVKIDCLVKVDVLSLIARAEKNPPAPIIGCVDHRSVSEILAEDDPEDVIKIFKMPPGWYAQESRFVPRKDGQHEDDGWVLSYVFDESQFDEHGDAGANATSELWIIDAKQMKEVVGRIKLPQRVPYGLHGNWFSEQDLENQRPVDRVRLAPTIKSEADEVLGSYRESKGFASRIWLSVRQRLLNSIG